MAHTIKDLIFTITHPKNNWKTDLLNQWQDIIGSLHSKVKIEKIYDDSLVLGVFHSCWMQELYLLSPLLIKTINEKLDQPHIKQIRFKHIAHKKKIIKKTPKPTAQKEYITLSKKEESILAHIEDPALREALRAFRIRCYQET